MSSLPSFESMHMEMQHQHQAHQRRTTTTITIITTTTPGATPPPSLPLSLCLAILFHCCTVSHHHHHHHHANLPCNHRPRGSPASYGASPPTPSGPRLHSGGRDSGAASSGAAPFVELRPDPQPVEDFLAAFRRRNSEKHLAASVSFARSSPSSAKHGRHNQRNGRSPRSPGHTAKKAPARRGKGPRSVSMGHDMAAALGLPLQPAHSKASPQRRQQKQQQYHQQHQRALRGTSPASGDFAGTSTTPRSTGTRVRTGRVLAASGIHGGGAVSADVQEHSVEEVRESVGQFISFFKKRTAAASSPQQRPTY